MQNDPRKIAHPRTTNEILVDRAIRHAIYVIRLSGGEARWLNEQTPQLRRAISDAVSPILTEIEGGDAFSMTDQRLIEQASMAAREAAYPIIQKIKNEHMGRLGDIARSEADFEHRLFQQAIPVEMAFDVPSDVFIQSVLDTDPISGKTIREWFDSIPNNLQLEINEQLQQGLLDGDSMQDMVVRIRGTRRVGYTDGIIAKVNQHMDTIVRTGVMAASNRARQAFHEANSEVIKGYNWILTLDSNTCAICVAGEHQNPYRFDNRPELPAHPRCRCVSTAITKSWRELGLNIDEMEPGQRATMDGLVPATTTYSEWFDRQSEAMKKDILGPSRYEAHKKGMEVTAFADRGQVMNLQQLREIDPGSF